jgi:hypothetical protein
LIVFFSRLGRRERTTREPPECTTVTSSHGTSQTIPLSLQYTAVASIHRGHFNAQLSRQYTAAPQSHLNAPRQRAEGGGEHDGGRVLLLAGLPAGPLPVRGWSYPMHEALEGGGQGDAGRAGKAARSGDRCGRPVFCESSCCVQYTAIALEVLVRDVETGVGDQRLEEASSTLLRRPVPLFRGGQFHCFEEVGSTI